MNFRDICNNSFSLIDRYFKESLSAQGESRICDYAPGTVKMWCRDYSGKYLTADGCLIISAIFEEGVPCFVMPVGRDKRGGLAALYSIMKDGGTLSVIPEDDIDLVRETFGGRVLGDFVADRDWSDYIYLKKEFESPSGKKRHSQKNHINRFLKEHRDYRFETICEGNLGAAKEYFRLYCKRNPDTSEVGGAEYEAGLRVLRDLPLYNMSGGLLYSDEENICGITVGEVFGDTVYVHIEKAEKEITGAYQTLSSLYMKSIADTAVVFVNREEDMGLAGLRRSKLSYVPEKLDRKYSVQIAPIEK